MAPLGVIKKVRTLLCRHPGSSPLFEANFLNLCQHSVHMIEDLVNGGNLINKRQCLDLSSKLSKTIHNIVNFLLHCGAPTDLFRPALENLYKILEKVKLLVNQCRSDDWIAASVFQIQNEKDFQVILLEVALCYNAIYEQAMGVNQEYEQAVGVNQEYQQEDLRQSSTFMPAPITDIQNDQEALKRKLEDLAAPANISRHFVRCCLLQGKLDLKQCLAQYLLVKLSCISQESRTEGLDISSDILWMEETQPFGTWGHDIFLGAGAGGCFVCSTKWLGIPCAKKLFHGEVAESIFLKEAGILAHLNHPHIVKFISCGNGLEEGNRFIAMELMDMSLSVLIKRRAKREIPFPYLVAVDIMVQIALGMCYLHGVGVAHRDLKPHNVVVNNLASPHLEDHYSVKLVDFGMSKTKVEVSKATSMSTPGIGTTVYRAPEVHPKALESDGKGKAIWFKADVYSFGITCAQILSLKPPFTDIQLGGFYEELMRGLRPELPIDCPDKLVALLKDCWDTSPRSRPTFLEICTRLEIIKLNLLGGESAADFGNDSTSNNFIRRQLQEHFSMERGQLDTNTDDEEVA